jgi:hypothetical protein
MFRVARFFSSKVATAEDKPSRHVNFDKNVDLNLSQADTDSCADSVSLPEGSESEDHGRRRKSVYETHAFQQRFHKDHPTPGVTMETFTSFMKRAASLSQSVASEFQPAEGSCKPLHSTRLGRRMRISKRGAAPMPWWSFERDYSEEKDELDEEQIDFDNSRRAGAKRKDDMDQIEFDGGYNDFVYGFGDEGTTSHLFSQQSIFREFATRSRSNKEANSTDRTKNPKVEHSVGATMTTHPEKESEIMLHPGIHPSKDLCTLPASNETSLEPLDDLTDVPFSHDNHFTSVRFASTLSRTPPFPQAPSPQHSMGCFDKIQLVTPEFFSAVDDASNVALAETRLYPPNSPPATTESVKSTPSSASLSSMVHSMDPEMFQSPPPDDCGAGSHVNGSDDSVSSLGSSCSSTPTTRQQKSIFRSQQRNFTEIAADDAISSSKTKSFESVRKKLVSSFRSKVSSNDKRVRYSLAVGKRGMTEKDRLNSAALLPTKPLLPSRQQNDSSASIPRGIAPLREQQPLSILLVNPVLKVFEIVLVDYLKDTTVGDVLSKARANATDESLSEQKYISLCNRKQELAAPMLPVSLLVEATSSVAQSMCDDASATSELSGNDLQDARLRREMESRLLVAVPQGSSAAVCQAIRRMLWKNPKVQRWWKQTDPFHRHVGRSVGSSPSSERKGCMD